MITRENFISAIDCMIQSAFVRKMVNTNTDDEDKIAKKINDSAYKVADIVKELESAKEVIISAGNENTEEFTQIATDYILRTRIGEKEKKVNAARNEYDNLPKVDYEYISWREAEEKKINDNLENEIEKLKSNAEEEKKSVKSSFMKDTSAKEKASKIAAGLVAIPLIASLLFTIIYATSGANAEAEIMMIFDIVFFGVFVYFCNMIKKCTDIRKKGRIPEKVINMLDLIDKRTVEKENSLKQQADNEIAKIREEGIDYCKGSEFDLKIRKANIMCLGLQLELLSEKQRMADFMYILDNFFVNAPDLLQRTIDNVSSLCTWANNYLQNKRLEKHYDELVAIERDKVRIQESMKKAQEKALEEQNKELRAQTKAMQAQAKAEEERARQAAKLAEETTEIRRKMDDENYGNRRLPL